MKTKRLGVKKKKLQCNRKIQKEGQQKKSRKNENKKQSKCRMNLYV